MNIRVYFWNYNSIPLIFMPIHIQVSHCLDKRKFAVRFEIKKCDHSNLSFLFQECSKSLIISNRFLDQSINFFILFNYIFFYYFIIFVVVVYTFYLFGIPIKQLLKSQHQEEMDLSFTSTYSFLCSCSPSLCFFELQENISVQCHRFFIYPLLISLMLL